jgi:cytochrome c556
MKKKFVACALAASLGGMFALDAAAQAKPEQLVHQRQSGMALIGWYFGPIGAMMRGDRPFDAAVVQRNTAYLEVLSKMPIEGFDPSTKDTPASTKGVKSATKPEAFAEMDKFKKGMEAFQGEVAKLAQVAKGGDQAAIRTQFGAVGKTCSACHDAYRVKQ